MFLRAQLYSCKETDSGNTMPCSKTALTVLSQPVKRDYFIHKQALSNLNFWVKYHYFAVPEM